MNAPAADPIVLVVDDDIDMRAALEALFRSVGLRVETFATTEDLLAARPPAGEGCLVLDVRLPGVGGLDFQGQLASTEWDLPVVFITGHGDIPMTVRAMKAGAVDFLAKPFRDQDLLDAVHHALKRDRARRRERDEAIRAQELCRCLTPREREVMAYVLTGRMNKQIAGEMALSEVTVKIHRSHLMRKLGARTFPELLRLAQAAGIQPAAGRV